MASVIHRTTLAFQTSVNTPKFPEPTYKHNPDMSAVAGVSRRYWEWDSGAERPVPMSQPDQDAVDAALLTAALDGEASKLDDFQDIIRAIGKLLVSEFNNHSVKINAILDAADAATSLGDFKSAVSAITDQPTRTLAQFRSAMRSNLGS